MPRRGNRHYSRRSTDWGWPIRQIGICVEVWDRGRQGRSDRPERSHESRAVVMYDIGPTPAREGKEGGGWGEGERERGGGEDRDTRACREGKVKERDVRGGGWGCRPRGLGD